MAERSKDALLEMTFDLDRFFHPGYVIELGEGVYYQGYKDGRVLVCAVSYAERFQRKEDAEKFIYRHLRYADMKACICEVCWVLLSVDTEEAEPEQYWDGRRFTQDLRKAATFSSYQEILSCQKRERLKEVSMIDLRTFRRREITMAA